MGSPAEGEPGVAFSETVERELHFEYANENRQAAINLGGTGVAILTFLLIFLPSKYNAVGLDGSLYRVTLSAVVFSIFFLGISGSYYYFLIEALERKRPDAPRFLQTADACFVLGLALLMLEPAMILFTLDIRDIGLIAIVLWALSLLLIVRGRRNFR
jgi:hypothetical protein